MSIQEIGDDLESANSIMVEIDVVASFRLQEFDQHLRITVERIGRLVVDARAVPVAHDLVGLSGKGESGASEVGRIRGRGKGEELVGQSAFATPRRGARQ